MENMLANIDWVQEKNGRQRRVDAGRRRVSRGRNVIMKGRRPRGCLGSNERHQNYRDSRIPPCLYERYEEAVLLSRPRRLSETLGSGGERERRRQAGTGSPYARSRRFKYVHCGAPIGIEPDRGFPPSGIAPTLCADFTHACVTILHYWPRQAAGNDAAHISFDFGRGGQDYPAQPSLGQY